MADDMNMIFVFDENCEEWNKEDFDYNSRYANVAMSRKAGRLECRHWLYLREVYDIFGADARQISPIIGWNGPKAELKYEIKEFPDANKIVIRHNAKSMI